MRSLIGLVLLSLATGTAVAAPVSIFDGAAWYAGTWNYLGTGSRDGGDPIGWSQVATERMYIENELGFVETIAHFEFHESLISTDDYLSYDSKIVLNIQGEVSADLPSTAYAEAYVGLFDRFFYLYVFEPVIYTGSLGLIADVPGPIQEFSSGSILGVGGYELRWWDSAPSLYYKAGPGESFDITKVTNHSFDFVRVNVPTPATLGLMLLGVFGIGFGGSRRARTNMRTS